LSKVRAGAASCSCLSSRVDSLLGDADFFATGSTAASAKRAGKKSKSRSGRVQTGLDVLESQKFAPLHGRHIGIITNHTGLDSQGKSTIDALAHAPGVQIVAIFSPEHGLSGQSDERVSSAKDPSTGLQVFSLYGETLRPQTKC